MLSVNNHVVGQRFTDTLYTQYEISKNESAEGRQVKIGFYEVRNGNNLSFNSTNREASIPKNICSAMKMVAL